MVRTYQGSYGRFVIKHKLLILMFFLLLVILLLLPYLKAELLTKKYGAIFEYEYQQSGMITEIEYFKVISCSNGDATVFYVLKNYSAGVCMNFRKEHESWQMVSWQVIWSTSGNADKFYWPYYR